MSKSKPIQKPVSKKEVSEPKRNTLTREIFQNSNCVVLTEKQTQLFKNIRNNTLTIVHGPAGTSKAQPLTSPILTPNGWTTMGELNIGDKVISVDGESTNVVGIFPQGEKEIYEFLFSDGSVVECCADHLWLTQTEDDRYNRKWSMAIDGKRKRYASPKEGSVKTTLEIIETLYTNRGRINHSIPMVKPVNFIKKDVEIDPYIMGFLLGDGCFRKSVSFSTIDLEIVENIKKLIENDGMQVKKRNQCDYAITDNIQGKNRYKSYLMKLGIWNKLSYEKYIPDCYKFNSIEDRIKLLQGLMDSDGTVSSDGLYVSFCSTSMQLICDVKEIVQSLGGIATEHTPRNENYTYNGVKKKGRESYNLTITMNPEINPFFLNRKSNIVVSKSRYKPSRRIISVKMIGMKKAQCIKIDHPTHLYVTNDYIVTHNTFTSCYTALSMLADKKIEQIIITKPNVESGPSLGFIPGSVDEKMDPYKQSYYTNFCKILDKHIIDHLFASGEIKFEPLSYMRGSTYDNCLMLLDECQNSAISQLMLWVTRLGKDSKAVMMGDTSQYDVRKRDSGYVDFIKMTEDMKDLSSFKFSNEDIVRNKFLIEMTNRYDKYRSDHNV